MCGAVCGVRCAGRGTWDVGRGAEVHAFVLVSVCVPLLVCAVRGQTRRRSERKKSVRLRLLGRRKILNVFSHGVPSAEKKETVPRRT